MRLLQERHVRQLVAANGWHVRDEGLLLSCLDVQYPSFGVDRYPTLADKAAALVITVNHNHPLLDGNKRLSWYLLRTLVLINDRDLGYTEDDAEILIRAIAAGEVAFDEVREALSVRILAHDPEVTAALMSPRTGKRPARFEQGTRRPTRKRPAG